MVAGVAVITGPWWLGRCASSRPSARPDPRAGAGRGRRARARLGAAHPTLIQRNADDPREVHPAGPRPGARAARLALPAAAPTRQLDSRPTLERAAAEVEDAHGVAIEVVVVGDCPLDERLGALLQAAREAMVNAAKYAGGAAVSVYAEVEPEQVTVFVRDRGPGFDPDAVPDDRLGCASRSSAGWSARRARRRPVRARRGHRGPAGDATREERAMTDVPSRDARCRVVLVDDHRMFRAGRARRARRRRRGRRRGRGRRQRRSTVITATRPDVVLLDVHLPGGGGRAVLRPLRAASCPDVRFLALSVSRRRRGRHRRRSAAARAATSPSRSPARARRRRPPGRRRRRGVLAAAGRLRARRVRRHDRRRRRRRGPRPAHPARARGAAADRPRLRLQGGRARQLFISVKTVETHVSACCASCSCPTGTS